MKKTLKRILSFALVLALLFGLFPPVELDLGNGFKINLNDLNLGLSTPAHAAGTLPTISGLEASWTDASNSKGKASWSASGTSITGTTTGYTQIIGRTVTSKLTLKNTSGSEATLKFSFTLTGGGSVTGISGGAYEGVLANNASIVITLKSPSGKSTNTLSITGLSLISTSAGNVTTTFKPAAGGSYTVNGTAITAETPYTNAAGTEYALVATPASGYQFLGWSDGSGYISYDASYPKYTPAADVTITPVFISSTTPLFGVGAARYDDLTEAANAAAAGTTKTVVLLNNGTLTGSHTIPSGVTLLIPFDDANTLYTTEPGTSTSGGILGMGVSASYTAPTVYRTLTMASGAHITVNGAISLSAKQAAAAGSKDFGGAPTGSVSMINMFAGSTITVNSGAALYAWGFITGSGAITAKSGASVYECFQFSDFRGGSATSELAETYKNYGVFPLNQYYVQNIEVALTLEKGAREYTHTAVVMQGVEFKATVGFIGDTDDCMFKLGSGTVTKRYDGTTDRLVVEANGTLSVSPIKMSIGGVNIDSVLFELPINHNISVYVRSGATIAMSQDIALLPGAEIIVEEGAFCTIAQDVNVYIYDGEQWGDYCGAMGGTQYIIPVKYAPGKKYNRVYSSTDDAKICVNGTMDASLGKVYVTPGKAQIYSTGNGKVIVNAVEDSITYQNIYIADNTEGGMVSIDVVSPFLLNSDGTYLNTKNGGANTYVYKDGKWVCAEGVEGCNGQHIWDNNCDAECNVCKTMRTPPHTPGDAATCTTAQTCTVCGATIKEELGHSYTSEVTTAPTCTEAGVKTFTCSACGDTYTEAIAATGHTDGEDDNHDCDTCGATNVDDGCHGGTAYCNAKAVCVECGQEYGEKAPTNHASGALVYEQIDSTKHREKHECCGVVYQEVSHTFVNGVCACKYVQDLNVKVTIDGIATNTTVKYGNGGTDYKIVLTLPICTTAKWNDTYLSSGIRVTIGGVAANSHCSYDPDTLTLSIPVDKLVGDVVITVTTTVFHKNLVKTEKKPATCTEAGYSEYYSCSGCGKYYSDATATQEVEKDSWIIPAIGHKNKVHHEKVAATCVTEGKIEYWSCPDCDKNFSDEACETVVTNLTIAIDPNNHVNKTEHKQQDATCLAVGYTAGTYCENCDKWISGHEEIPALGHNMEGGESKVPTCTEPGYKTHVCTRCDYTEKYETEATGHNWIEATCSSAKICANCGATEGDVKNHSWGDIIVVTKPTCTEGGTNKVVCADCGAVSHLPVAALGHDEVAHEAKAPTCTAIGWDAYVTCSRCDYTTYAEKEALGHDEKTHEAKAPTCTAIGWDAYVTCSRCDYTTYAEKAALGHDEVSHEAQAPTCTEIGWDAYVTCSRCDYTTYAEKAALGHDEVAHDAKAPTCTEIGWDAYVTCSRCDHTTYVEKEVLGHRFTDNNDTECDYCDYSRFAYIGNVNYETLEDALTAAQEDDTIVVLKQIIIEGDVTWDLTGKTLDVQYINAGDYVLKVRGNLTIVGGSFNFANIYGIGVTANGELTIEGGTFTTPADYYLIGSWGETTIKGGEFTSVYCNVNGFVGKLTITGGTFNVTDKETGSDVLAGDGVASISGGNFSTNVTEYCVEGYHTLANADNRFVPEKHAFSSEWTVDDENHWHECACGAISEKATHKYYDEFDASCDICEHTRTAKTLIAMIGDQKFDSLAAAVATAKDGETIVLYADVTLTERLVVTTEQNWNFGNFSVTLANEKDNYSIVVKGDLTINSGTIIATGVYGIGVTGKLTVNDGEIAYTGSNDYLIGNWGTTVINGGSFNGQYCCINNFAGTTTINDGSFTTDKTDASGEWPSCDLFADSGLIVKGGTFSKDVTEYCADDYHTVDTDNDGVYTYGAHSYVSEVTPPTCSDEGYTTYTCVCGDTYTAERVAANGHSWTAAECETPKTCSVCGVTEGEPLGHTEGEIQFRWTVINPTGTAYWNCETCGEQFDLETTTEVTTKDGDCQNRSQTIYTATATYEGQTYTSTYIVNGGYGAHIPGEAVRENEVPATCYAEGSYDEVIYCSVEECKHEISREKKSIEKTEHTPGEAVRENEVPATCYAEGSYEEVIYCSVENCKHEISREEKSIEKTDIPVNAHKDLLPGIQVEGNVITVTSELACKVGYQLLDENGNVIEGYISLAGVKVGDNTYTFTIPTPNEAKVDVHSVVVVLSGDVNQDGALTAADKTWLEESMSGDRTLDAIQAFAADVNSNGKVNSADRILLARTLMYIKKLSTTNPIAWYTGNGTGEN